MTSPQQQGFATLNQPGTTPFVTSIFNFSTEALAQLKLWLEGSGFALPISNLVGYTQTTPKIADAVRTTETTDTSGTYKDLATVGPQLTGLPDGNYLLIYACLVTSKDAAGIAYMSPSINAATPADANAAGLAAGVNAPGTGIWWGTFTLNAGGGNTNTVKMQYRNAGGGGGSAFANRVLLAIKVS